MAATKDSDAPIANPRAVTDLGNAILAILATSAFPVGARVIYQRLHESGHQLSEASISRMLARFDAEGWTVKAGAKGRVLTTAGRRFVTTQEESRRRDIAYAQALEISDVDQVHDLLCARRAVESESCRAAAAKVTPDDLRELELLLDRQRKLVSSGDTREPAMTFHRLISRLSDNDLLIAMSETILHENLDYLEHVLDLITVGLPSFPSSITEHQLIIDALRAGDGDSAAAAMEAHLSRLIDEVATYRTTERAPAFNGLLELVSQRTHASDR